MGLQGIKRVYAQGARLSKERPGRRAWATSICVKTGMISRRFILPE